MKSIVISTHAFEARGIEIVERKGLGHPDSICDALAENLSRALCREYRRQFGLILHHNVDKVLLSGGRASPAFGGGTILAPINALASDLIKFGNCVEYVFPILDVGNGQCRRLRGRAETMDRRTHARLDQPLSSAGARISCELIVKKGFRFIAIEGDWPDAARVDHYVRHLEYPASEWTAFARFPTWMWRNNEVRDFVNWLREHNAATKPVTRVAFHGLDLYSLYVSIRSVLSYLDRVDPDAARVARQRYGCLTPWQGDPATYGHAALTGSYRTCEQHVVRALKDLLDKRLDYVEHDGERFFDAVQNARLVANAERYYRIMYYGSRASWNLRDEHMFTTLKNLLTFYGTSSKAIVWAHNSHVGDSAATEMASLGEHNIGHLCRQEFGGGAYLVGFGTNSGTVAAASDWDGPMEIKKVQPALPKSYERLCHATGHARFTLGLRNRADLTGAQGLGKPQLERAIGVIYRPETERASHYFQAVLPRQFNEYIWFDDTRAVTPFETAELVGLPDTYPFGV